MNIHSSEGDLLHQPKVHGHLAYLEANVGLAYVRPTPAQYAVFRYLDQAVEAGEHRLRKAIANAKKLL